MFGWLSAARTRASRLKRAIRSASPATDCGSTTTKAILIEKVGDEYRQTWRGEAPTTVEAPFEDVTRGVINAATEVQELSGRKLVTEDGRILTPEKSSEEGVDLYISTSSAGGGASINTAVRPSRLTRS